MKKKSPKKEAEMDKQEETVELDDHATAEASASGPVIVKTPKSSKKSKKKSIADEGTKLDAAHVTPSKSTTSNKKDAVDKDESMNIEENQEAAETTNKAIETIKEQVTPNTNPKGNTSKPQDSKRKKKRKKDKSSTAPPNNSTPKPKTPPIFDMQIHRLRFLKLHPKSIFAMASSPHADPTSTSSTQLLAISRQGGSVELIDPMERWISVGSVPGVRGREVDALCWVRGTEHKDHTPFLIGASRDGTIFQLDFYTQRQICVVASGSGGVFCLASPSSGREPCASGYFAAGCEDGTVKIYRVKDGLELVSSLPSVGNAVLSLAWMGNVNNNALGGSVIFAGCADGTIRRFDCVSSGVTTSISTGSVLSTSDVSGGRGSTFETVYRWRSTLRMVVENRGLRESTKVWALKVLSDGTVISGDSLGNVQLWDGLFGTMLQTFSQSESGADVLCLAVSDDENKVFASGVDARVMCIQRQGQAVGNQTNINSDSAPIRKWINVCAHRKHSHDVRALAICHKTAAGSKTKMELLVSGSIDTRLCSYVTNDFRSSRPRIWFNWPSISPISISRTHRLVAVTRNDGVDLYRLATVDQAQGIDESKSLVQTISIKSAFNLNCSTISEDGKFLAASDASTLYVFSLNVKAREDGTLELHPAKLHLSKECRRPSTALRFDSAQRLICAAIDGSINVIQLSQEDDVESAYNASSDHVFNEHSSGTDPPSHKSTVISIDVSLDGKWFAVSRFSHKKGSVHAFSIEPFGHYWSLPEVEATSTCIKFLAEGSLAVGCANNSFYIFNLQRRELSNWSHDMGLPIVKSLPRELSSRTEPLARILMTPSLQQKLILGAHGFFCVVDLDKPVPDKSNTYPPNSLRARRSIFDDNDANLYSLPTKRQKHSNENNPNFTTCLRYNNILFQDFLNEQEMIVVEEPWRSVLEELPEALERRVYGT